MGNKNSYDVALKKYPDVKKLGRYNDDAGEYYAGGCCWPTYDEAKAYIKNHMAVISSRYIWNIAS